MDIHPNFGLDWMARSFGYNVLDWIGFGSDYPKYPSMPSLIKNFYELRQLSIRSLVYRNHYSNNNLITILIDSNIHNDSDLSREWRDFLFC